MDSGHWVVPDSGHAVRPPFELGWDPRELPGCGVSYSISVFFDFIEPLWGTLGLYKGSAGALLGKRLTIL